MGTVIQMYTATNPADNLASIDVTGNGHLVGVDWVVRPPVSGADLTVNYQLSFASTSQFTSNDARAVITNCGVTHDFTTSGGAQVAENKYVPLPDIPVQVGERIFLHGTGTAVAVVVNAGLHFDYDLDRPRTRMR